ncbi:MAG: cell wall metabolism sensor histidine kinase WalK [Clostridia bacterium]|nr:cell wall metabolism sensor histidine kinase WalK [Clostridia bacterium]
MFLRRILRSLLRSLQWRLVFIFIAMTIFLIIPVGLSLNASVESSYYDSFTSDIDEGFRNWKIGERPSYSEIITDLRERRERIYLFNITSENKTYTIYNISDRKVEFSSDPEYIEQEEKFELDVLSSKNFISVLSGKENGKNLVHSNGRSFFDYARKKGDFIIYFRYYSEAWSETIENFNKIILNSIGIAILISLILGYILSKTITVPIVNIMHKAQEIADGDFDRLLEVKSDDEIGKLTKTFNYMAKELKNTLNEISSEKNKIETILNYMTDGVIAFNLKGEVIHANPAAERMLGLNNIGYTFNDFSKSYDLGIALEEILYLGTSSTNTQKEIDIGDKIISVYFALFTDEEEKIEGIIAVLQDITEQQKLERMRREFVANVSHELRTPLTSIKSYTETLLDGALEDRETTERFLNVIDSESDRMTRLVKDLLQLSRLDNQQMQWIMQEVSFEKLVREAVDKIRIEAVNKGQLLESYVIGDIPAIIADHDRIEQVVLNILSNAIKYTPQNGKITVYIGRMYSDVYMKVSDTGIGIPESDLPRIFERFYRVDKARSREMGGTGLGLAIAKEIVEAHGGSIAISSEGGKGTEVTVKLPIKREG